MNMLESFEIAILFGIVSMYFAKQKNDAKNDIMYFYTKKINYLSSKSATSSTSLMACKLQTFVAMVSLFSMILNF